MCFFFNTHLKKQVFRLSETSVILTKPSTDYSSVKGARAVTCNQRSCIFRGVVFRVAAHCRATPSVNSGRSGVPEELLRFSLVHGRTFAELHSFLCASDFRMRSSRRSRGMRDAQRTSSLGERRGEITTGKSAKILDAFLCIRAFGDQSLMHVRSLLRFGGKGICSRILAPLGTILSNVCVRSRIIWKSRISAAQEEVSPAVARF